MVVQGLLVRREGGLYAWAEATTIAVVVHEPEDVIRSAHTELDHIGVNALRNSKLTVICYMLPWPQ